MRLRQPHIIADILHRPFHTRRIELGHGGCASLASFMTSLPCDVIRNSEPVAPDQGIHGHQDDK